MYLLISKYVPDTSFNFKLIFSLSAIVCFIISKICYFAPIINIRLKHKAKYLKIDK